MYVCMHAVPGEDACVNVVCVHGWQGIRVVGGGMARTGCNRCTHESVALLRVIFLPVAISAS